MGVAGPAICSGAIRKLILIARELGVDADAICSEVGFDPAVCEDADARVPLVTLHELWEAFLRREPRPDLALLGAQRYLPGDYGLVGFVAMNSATLGEGVAHVVRYVHLWTDDPGMTLLEDGALEVVHHTKFADRPGLRCTTEAAVAEVLHGARLITQTFLAPKEVRFSHEAPADTSAHEKFFGAPVRFRQPTTAIQFAREQLAIALPKADPQLSAFLQNMANEALARQQGPERSELDQIRGIIAEELNKGVPTLEQLSRRMATSERTLRRRLEQEGCNFRELLDTTRAALARSYVRDRRLPLSEVAFLLGFSEPSAFHRAFKRWTDTTPAAWRERSV